MLRNDFDNVKLATETGAVLTAEAAVTFKDGFIFAKNRHVAACAPTEIKDNFSVAASALAFNLSKVSDAARVKVTPTRVKLVDGSHEIQMQRVTEEIEYEPPQHEGLPVSSQFIEALRLVLPFAGEEEARPWTMGALIRGEQAFTTNNQVLACGQVGPNPFDGETLPQQYARFLVKREGLQRIGKDEYGFFAWYEGGGWVRASRLANGMPERVPQLLDQVYQDPQWEIPDGWHRAFMGSVTFTEEVLTIQPDRILGVRGQNDHTCWVTSDVEEAVFDAKPLTAVIERASHINLRQYPNPVSFKQGDVLRGIIAGRRQ